MHRATTEPFDGERGLTVVELMVTMLVLGIIAAAAFAVLFRAFDTTNIVTSRRDVLGDGQFALDQMTKHIRQAESIDTAVSDADTIEMETYVNGEAKTIVWRVIGSSAPYELQLSTDGGTNYHTVLAYLASTDLLTYTSHDGVLDQVTIALALGTDTSTVEITSDVNMRNV